MLYNNSTINIQKLNSQNQISQNFLFEKGKEEEEKKDILLKDKKKFHLDSINCLKSCSSYKLNITIKHNKETTEYPFNTNDVYFYGNISSDKLLKLLEEKEENENLNLNKYNLQNLFDDKDKEKVLSQKIFFPIQNNQNKISNEISIWEDLLISLNKNTSCLLIEINLDNNLNEQNINFKEINKQFIKTQIDCVLNGIVHEREILKNDIVFSIDTKKIIKSIEFRIQNYKNQYLKLSKEEKKSFKFRNLFFTTIFKQSNLAFTFSTNNKENLIDLENLKTNFNSIPTQKFHLIKLFIAINIPNSLPNKYIDEKEKAKTNYSSESSKGINNLSNYSDDDLDIFTVQSCLNQNNNSFNNFNQLFGNDCKIFNANNKNFYPNMINHFPNYYLNMNNLMIKKRKNQINNNKIKQIKNNFPDDLHLNSILIDKTDLNAIHLFKCFKTKSKSLSNFIIFKNMMKRLLLNLQVNLLLPFKNYIESLKRISYLGMNIPLINNKGKYYLNSFSVTLSSLTLFIEHNELYMIIYNTLNRIFRQKKSASTTNIFSNSNNNFWSHNEFIEINENTKISLLNQYIIIEFNENKPHYMRKTLYENLNNIFNSLPKTMNPILIGNLQLQRSYFSFLWGPINTFLNHTSFLTYHLFTFDLIGILPIKLEYNKWLSKIGLEKKENIVKKENEINDSIVKVETFVYEYSFFNSYDYEFYQQNKLYVNV